MVGLGSVMDLTGTDVRQAMRSWFPHQEVPLADSAFMASVQRFPAREQQRWVTASCVHTARVREEEADRQARLLVVITRGQWAGFALAAWAILLSGALIYLGWTAEGIALIVGVQTMFVLLSIRNGRKYRAAPQTPIARERGSSDER